jgi:predicted enzyme related to lactoylglutathione lyase
LFQPGGHTGAAPLGPVAGTFGWCELATPDVDAARRFYTELFGWTARESKNSDMPYTEWVAHDQPIGGMMPLMPQHGDAPPHWLPYVMVDDCDATVQKASAAGGSVCVSPMDIPHVGRIAVFNDPTGAMLAIIHLQENPQ